MQKMVIVAASMSEAVRLTACCMQRRQSRRRRNKKLRIAGVVGKKNAFPNPSPESVTPRVEWKTVVWREPWCGCVDDAVPRPVAEGCHSDQVEALCVREAEAEGRVWDGV